ncbi:hypothetical protein PISL3812_00669 [Talaromyces islandicus]|uniref:DUF7730 domain-containing protein n=1 Tax=Talaromyces islandicus TaxID=28573 RepID=A0A0U1LJY7_TALIS|nr:hypothetical protein PISL3812_00669 [Talaromyces islandicus]
MSSHCSVRYSETVNLLYDNMFDFDSLDTVVSLSRTVLKTRLDRIRKVRLQDKFPYDFYVKSDVPDGKFDIMPDPSRVPPYDAETWEQTAACWQVYWDLKNYKWTLEGLYWTS